MTRRAEQIPLDDDWVLTKVWSKSRSAPAILAAINNVPKDAGVEPVTPPEPAPVVYPPNCEGDARYGQEPTQSGQAAEILIELTEGDE